MTEQRKTPRSHAGEGIEDGVNVVGVVLVVLGVVALALALVAGGYGFGGWAIVGAVACVLLLFAGTVVLALEWRRRRQRKPDDYVRQGH
ncbi:hypothetical protein D7D52_20595 [Nocardia yunnanensis]|uniref:Uncharacterized protein n=1 Tax=Nocardia yunnanensis TaxID=2382165 RepID=A0A386ZF61_9NOCA|nr:hypothetical protein [Nocardia yunnanensis]AYF75843.1 hypothetical protein D7D52_20595 [Nocardia yunnanensis]